MSHYKTGNMVVYYFLFFSSLKERFLSYKSFKTLDSIKGKNELIQRRTMRMRLFAVLSFNKEHSHWTRYSSSLCLCMKGALCLKSRSGYEFTNRRKYAQSLFSSTAWHLSLQVVSFSSRARPPNFSLNLSREILHFHRLGGTVIPGNAIRCIAGDIVVCIPLSKLNSK